VERRRTTIGQAVDQAIKETTEEWFSEHCGHRSREVAASEDITQISATVELKCGGRLQVFVGVSTRKYNAHLHNWYRYQRSGQGGYVRDEATNSVR
jgi:hypothetical protein